MVVMGLDISLTSTGICIRKDMVPVSITSIKTSKEELWFDRITRILNEVLSMIALYKVEYVVIENYSFGSTNGRELLGEIHGVIMFEFEKRDIPFLKIPPTQIKLFGCGAGKAPKCPPDKAKSTWAKTWVVIETNRRYDTDFRLADNDKCDAFLIALLAETLRMVVQDKSVLERLLPHQEGVIRSILNIPKPKKPRGKK